MMRFDGRKARQFRAAAAVFLLLASCVREKAEPPPVSPAYAAPAAAVPNPQWRERARELARLMSDGELAGQVIMTGIDACGAISPDELNRLTRIRPGAIMLFRKNLDTENELIRRVNSELASVSSLLLASTESAARRIEPFIACDHEGGDVDRFRKGNTDSGTAARLPAPLSYSELAKSSGQEAAAARVQSDAAKAARELRSLGVNMNLAPVVEPLAPENEAFLLTRSYGADPAWAAKAALQFITGMESAGVACVIKHFPGNSSVDPHQKLPVLAANEAELSRSAAPFYTVIAEGLPAGVMVAHSIAQAWDAERPASLSPFVIQRKLVEEGALYGIVLADDFSMGAITGGLRTERAVINALAAGVDMVMAWPANLNAIHGAILAALSQETLDRERLRAAAERILYQKIRFGLAE